ncbi:hypothetical protein [Paenarthrobacter sp. NPDC057981]|uniref:hypothetical protein n=1 Tax=Paenarthrobacter sp. NPDC057981 TaxID=3346297 RepID=UPI0036DEA111
MNAPKQGHILDWGQLVEEQHSGQQMSNYTQGPKAPWQPPLPPYPPAPVDEAPTRPRTQRRPRRILAIVLANLALIALGTTAGTAVGYNNGYGTASSEASARPIPTVTATETVTQTKTVPQTPYACTQALQYADQIMDLAVQTINALSDTSKALSAGDTAGIVTATARMQSLQTRLNGLEGLRTSYLVAKAQCR